MTGHKNTTKYAPNILSWAVHGVKLISEEKACSVPMQEESRAKNEHSKVKKTPYSSYAGTAVLDSLYGSNGDERAEQRRETIAFVVSLTKM